MVSTANKHKHGCRHRHHPPACPLQLLLTPAFKRLAAGPGVRGQGVMGVGVVSQLSSPLCMPLMCRRECTHILETHALTHKL